MTREYDAHAMLVARAFPLTPANDADFDAQTADLCERETAQAIANERKMRRFAFA